jgi:cobalt-zinc-cadmium efflux system outer membrane protein
MRRRSRRALHILFPLASIALPAAAQAPLSWEQVLQRFQQNNPALIAGQTNVEETRANEITAGLKPNPQLSLTFDQWALFQTNPYQPFANAQSIVEVTQLIERRRKRPLRVESAQLATSIAGTDQADAERQLVFTLRDGFVRLLQAKSVLELAQDNLKYYEQVIDVNRRRFEAGDLARADFDRIALQRAQYDSDLETAKVNLRTAKITLLSMMNDKHPVNEFDIAGKFDFGEKILLPEELHQAALDARGDIRSAETNVRKAEVDNRLAWANGSWDPTIGGDYTLLGSVHTVGVDLSIPLRIFDKNQGEKARTAVEMKRSKQFRDSVVNSAFRDVDTAYAQIESLRALLRPYRDTYLPQALRVRDSVSYAYAKGGASLLDFLDAQKSYRDTELSYRNLIGSYLSAVNQLNLAVGREVLQ